MQNSDKYRLFLAEKPLRITASVIILMVEQYRLLNMCRNIPAIAQKLVRILCMFLHDLILFRR